MQKTKKTLFSLLRTKMRKYIFKWWWFKAVKIYGNKLAPTVRLSRTTMLDKLNPGGDLLMITHTLRLGLLSWHMTCVDI